MTSGRIPKKRRRRRPAKRKKSNAPLIVCAVVGVVALGGIGLTLTSSKPGKITQQEVDSAVENQSVERATAKAQKRWWSKPSDDQLKELAKKDAEAEYRKLNVNDPSILRSFYEANVKQYRTGAENLDRAREISFQLSQEMGGSPAVCEKAARSAMDLMDGINLLTRLDDGMIREAVRVQLKQELDTKRAVGGLR